MNQDQVIELVRRADAMLEERRTLSSRPPPPVEAAGTATNVVIPEGGSLDKTHGGAFERRRSKAPHPMSDMVTRVSAMPLPPEAHSPIKPVDASPRTASGKKLRYDPQADVVTRVIPKPKLGLFGTESEPMSGEPSVARQPGKPPTRAVADTPALPMTHCTSNLWAKAALPKSGGSPEPATLLKRRIMWIIGGVGMAGILTLTGLYILRAPTATTEKSVPPESTYLSEPIPRRTETEKVASRTPPAAASGTPEPPTPATVLIYLDGAPEESRVKVDGVVSALPLRLPKSSEILTVTVTAKGYKRWYRRIVPDRERRLHVRMTRKGRTKKK